MEQTVVRRPGGRARPLAANERRALIVAAATPLIRERGPSVTTREIADAAGIAEGTIFRVFVDKDALLHAVVEAAFAPDDALRALEDLDPDLRLDARLRAIIDIARRRVTGIMDLMMAVGGPRMAPRRPDGTSGPAEGGRRWAAADAAIVSRVIALIEPDADNLRYPPARIADILRMLTFASAHPVMACQEPLGTDELADLLLHGVRARDCQPHSTDSTQSADQAEENEQC